MTENFVEGWTERIVETLLADGSAQNLTGLTVTMLLYDNSNRLVSYTGSAGTVTAASGTVYFDPASTDLLASKSPYRVRWKITDSNGKIALFPNAESVIWVVRKP